MSIASNVPKTFVVSAPGKVIVHGEHSVVHGKAAIAAAISLRSHLLVSESPSTESKWTLDFPDVGLLHAWSTEELPWAAFAAPGKKRRFEDSVTTLDPELLEQHLHPLVDALSPNAKQELRKVHQSASLAFLYVLLSLGSADDRPRTYHLTSDIPIASGLGSSASISVCLATAILFQGGYISVPESNTSEDAREKTLEIINHWAFVGELCIHGNPSGVDNTVATRGKAVLFKRTEAGTPPKVTPVKQFPVLPLLLVNTKQSRSTAAEVAKVGALKKEHPTVVNLTLDAMDKITESAHALITSPDFKADDGASLSKLGDLIRMNHGMLVSLGVSHPRLERIREMVDYTNIGWTKLTGAGGGGCAITILKPDASDEVKAKLEKDLESEGFERYETELGGPGVSILTVNALAKEDDANDLAARLKQLKLSTPKSSWAHWGPS